MMEFLLYGKTNYNIPLSIIDTSLEEIIWILFIFILFLISIISSIILFLYSKNPEELEHRSIIESDYKFGKLQNLSNQIYLNPIDYSENSSLFNQIQMLFFEKIKSVYGLSYNQIFEMKTKNPDKLKKLIDDDTISNFIFNVQKKDENQIQGGFLKKEKDNKKQKFFNELNLVLDKMEVWGQ